MPEPAGERLLDREGELEVAAAALDRAREGEGGLLVFLGPAGIGKTRLLETLRRSAEEGGTRVLKARASQLETSFPFGVARQLFEPVIAEASEAEASELLSGAAGLVPPAAGPAGRRARRRGLGLRRAARTALADREPRRARAPGRCSWTTPTGRTPTRCASSPTSRPASRACRCCWRRPFARPSPGSTATCSTRCWRPRAPRWSSRALCPRPRSPSSPGGCWRATSLRSSPAPATTPAAATRSSARSCWPAASAAGVEPDAGAAASVAQIGPETVGRAVLARLARLPEPCTELARALAVLGGRAELRQAAPLAGLDEGEAARCADALAGVQLLRGERPLDFAHPIVRTSIYRSMGPLERAGMHAQAARALTEAGAEAEEVAVHLVEIEPSGDPRSPSCSREAATAAAERGAPADRRRAAGARAGRAAAPRDRPGRPPGAGAGAAAQRRPDRARRPDSRRRAHRARRRAARSWRCAPDGRSGRASQA